MKTMRKSCPFCGGKGYLKETVVENSTEQYVTAFRIYCRDCWITTPRYDAEKWARKAWNRRSI